jgi:uncharacterized protein (DUF1778 family)
MPIILQPSKAELEALTRPSTVWLPQKRGNSSLTTLNCPVKSRTIMTGSEASIMPSEGTRTARIEARIAPEALDVVKRAAELQGRSVSDFVVSAAQEAAARTIEQAQIIRLSVEDQRAIAAAVLNPPPLTPAMERAVARHRELISASR